MATQLTTNVPSAQPRPPPNQAPRASFDRPVRKLTEQLLGTYRHINEVYYQKKKDRMKEREKAKDSEFDIQPGQVLDGRFRVETQLGKGSFGQVIRAVNVKTEEKVAIKVIRARAAFRIQAKTEIMLLEHLGCMDADDKWCIVRLQEQFDHQEHTCLVFEQLSFNLYELLHRTRFNGVSLNLVRKFARQLLKSLAFLSLPDVDIIHCDLKPENILLRVSNRSAIKVIDFGSSCRRTEQMYVYIQSRFYRSPEVILGLPYTQAIDMWSLGCILVELHVGTPLFAGEDEHDQIIRFSALKGQFPQWMLQQGKKTAKFFDVFSPRVSPLLKAEDPGREASRAAVRKAREEAVARREARAAAGGWGGYVKAMAPVPEKPTEGGMPGSNAPIEGGDGDKKATSVSKVPMKREHDWPAHGVPVDYISDEDAGGDSDVEEWEAPVVEGLVAPPLLTDTPVGAVAVPAVPHSAVASGGGDANGGSGGSTGGTGGTATAGTGSGEARSRPRGAFVGTGVVPSAGGAAALGAAAQARERRRAAHSVRMERLRRPKADAHRGVVQYQLKQRRKPSKRKSHRATTVHTSMSELLGVHTGGPGGRRATETGGHSEWHYAQFMDMINRMLEYDPNMRMTPMQALNHPFLREDDAPGWDPDAPGNQTDSFSRSGPMAPGAAAPTAAAPAAGAPLHSRPAVPGAGAVAAPAAQVAAHPIVTEG